MRMRLDLEEHDFTVEYLKGKDHHIADALNYNRLKKYSNE